MVSEMAKKTKMRRSPAARAFDALNIVILLAIVLATVYPLYYIAIVSISDGTAVNRGDVKLLPVDVTFEAYATVVKNPDIWRAYGNTLLYTVVGTAINLIMVSVVRS